MGTLSTRTNPKKPSTLVSGGNVKPMRTDTNWVYEDRRLIHQLRFIFICFSKLSFLQRLNNWSETKEEFGRLKDEYDNKIDTLREMLKNKQQDAHDQHEGMIDYIWQVSLLLAQQHPTVSTTETMIPGICHYNSNKCCHNRHNIVKIRVT